MFKYNDEAKGQDKSDSKETFQTILGACKNCLCSDVCGIIYDYACYKFPTFAKIPANINIDNVIGKSTCGTVIMHMDGIRATKIELSRRKIDDDRWQCLTADKKVGRIGHPCSFGGEWYPPFVIVYANHNYIGIIFPKFDESMLTPLASPSALALPLPLAWYPVYYLSLNTTWNYVEWQVWMGTEVPIMDSDCMTIDDLNDSCYDLDDLKKAGDFLTIDKLLEIEKEYWK